MYKYTISGDRSGETYGIYRSENGQTPDKAVLVESGLKTLSECQQRIKELERVAAIDGC